MDEEQKFIKKMAKQTAVYAIILFLISIFIRVYDISFIVSSYWWSLFFSAICGLQIVTAFDWHQDGARTRPFGLFTLYLIGLTLGIIIFYLVISNVPIDMLRFDLF
ncbi:hypothetical protein [Methanobrevibacter oralis]|uniref:Uncharacterized protein n=1 Tax=Methanobrevibacter oralis TaxID=66851 RepID=A0A166B6W4_METOA|nr:hypothetical protein [Methanobrevibacter oralis]KZX12948.1 hypothetical protein MBORA_09910 [Methanobrevibacter oralis]